MMVYILEFSQALGSVKHSAQLYIGSCRDDLLEERISQHRAGIGAAITRAAVQRGYQLNVVALFPGGRQEERQLKRQKNARRFVQRAQRSGATYDHLNCCL